MSSIRKCLGLIRRAGATVVLCAAIAALAQPAAADQPPQSALSTEAERGIRPERAFTVYFGRLNARNFTSILTEPWKLSDEDTKKVGVSVSHLVWDLYDDTWIEGEVGVSKRFGEADEWEAFGLIFLRWDGVPWSDWLYTSFGIGVGPSFVTEISETERKRSGNDEGSRTLNMLVPEVAFALPDYTDAQLVFRLHHRSGVFGLFSGVSAGSTFMTAGLRIGF